MDVINDLGGIINQDLSPSKHTPAILYDSENFRVTTEYGASTLSRTNIKGEVDLLSIPQVYSFWKIEINSTGSETLSIGFNGGLDTFTFDVSDGQSIVDAFIPSGNVNNIYRLYAASDGNVYCYGLTTDVITIGALGTKLTATRLYIPGNQPYVMGWGVLREDIYIFTTHETSLVQTGYNQIWKLTYPKSGDYTDSSIYTFELMWYGQGGMTLQRPIANPGAIELRYENTNIQRIYWTDYYNTPRTINVADPECYTLLPQELNLFPSLTFDIPLFTKLEQSGNLPVGLYQLAYRLKRFSGSQSQFSTPSAAIAVTKSNEENETFIKYVAGNSSDIASKSLTFTLNNIDTTFSTIEIASIYYDIPGGIPVVKIVAEEPISTDSFNYTLTGNEESYEITIDEFTAFAPNIIKAKSLVSKNNTLFLSNVEVDLFEVNYDTRAYRFPLDSSTTVIKDGQGVSYTVDSSTWQIIEENGVAVTPYAIPQDHDCIQSYADQAPTSTDNLLYIANTGPGNNYLLGGTGPNISWSFNRETITLDEKDIGTSYTANTYSEAPHRLLYKQTSAYTGFTTHPSVNINFYDSFHSSYLNTSMKQYQRDEMYRFGIVFYNSQGNPSYVNWIADIRMPSPWMPNGTNKWDRELLYPTSSYSSGVATGSLLGLRVVLTNLNTIPDIKAFEIVRAPREEADRHILGQGRLEFAYRGDGIDPQDHFLANGNYQNTNRYDLIQPHMFTLKSPDLQFNNFEGYQSGDEIDIIGLLDDNQYRWLYQSADNKAYDGSDDEWGSITKNYSWLNTTSPIEDSNTDNPYPVRGAASIDQASWENTDSASNYSSLFPALTAIGSVGVYMTDTDNSSAVRNQSIVNKCLGIIYGPNNSPVAGLPYGGSDNFRSAGDNYASVDTWGNSNASYIANYKRNVTNQYGGNTYSQRSKTKYINCNSRQLITGNGHTVDVFGGDNYIVAYDNVSEFSDWNQPVKFTRFFIFACESNINTELRGIGTTQNVPNRNNPSGNNFGAGDLDASELYEKFDNNLLSFDTYVKVYFPKPFGFNEQTEFDTRTYKSDVKTNGELIDSWSTFGANAFIDVESKYGPINNLIVFQDKLLFFQDRGFGVLQVNDQKIVSDVNDTSEIVLGSSGILERFDYISTSTGSKHQFSFAYNDYTLIWFDTLSRKIYRYSPGKLEPITDVKGLSSLLYTNLDGNIQTTDNPYLGTGVHATYDYRYNEYRITFLHRDDEFYKTIVYSDLLDGFIGKYTSYPTVYINDKLNIFAIPFTNLALQKINLHNYGDYGKFVDYLGIYRTYGSSISYIVNENPTIEKVLTNQRYSVDVYKPNTNSIGYNAFAEIDISKTFDQFRYYNTYQNTNWQDASNLTRRHKTMWNVKVPTDRVIDVNQNIFDISNLANPRPKFTRRLKDKWFMCEAVYFNNDNYRIVANNVTSTYSLNSI